jgi:hypothetical protein
MPREKYCTHFCNNISRALWNHEKKPTIYSVKTALLCSPYNPPPPLGREPPEPELLEPELEPDVPELLPAAEPDVLEPASLLPEPAPEPPAPEPGVVLPELDPEVPVLEPLPLVVLEPLPCIVSVPPKLLVRVLVSIPVLMPEPAALPIVSIVVPVPVALFMSVVLVSPEALLSELSPLLQAIKRDKAAAVTKTRFMLRVLMLEIRYCCDRTLLQLLCHCSRLITGASYISFLIHSFLSIGRCCRSRPFFYTPYNVIHKRDPTQSCNVKNLRLCIAAPAVKMQALTHAQILKHAVL